MGRCLGHWSNYHSLCRVSDNGRSRLCQFLTGPHLHQVCTNVCIDVRMDGMILTFPSVLCKLTFHKS